MITIKIGGSVVDNLHPSTIDDIKKVAEQEGVILVHGGGKEVQMPSRIRNGTLIAPRRKLSHGRTKL